MKRGLSQRLASPSLAGARAAASCKFAHSIVCALFLLCGFISVPGCGPGGSAGSGGTGGSGSGGANAPTITSLSPGSATAGASAFTLTVDGTNFAASGTSVEWNGTSLTTTYLTGSAVTAPVTAQMIATTGTATVTVTTADGTSSGAPFTINAPSAPTVTAAHAPLRTRYLRTNSFYDPNSLQTAPPHFSVYDAARQQFFVSNPYMNEIDVFSAASETQTAAISVPMAWGIDISPVDGSLWAGTFLGDLYHINTSTLSVIARYPASTIGPNGFEAQTALVLANGNLVLQGGARGILGVDGFGKNVMWDPSTNAVNTGNSGIGSLCGGNGGISLDGTRTIVLVTTVDEGGGALPLCSYDSATGVAIYTTYVPTTATFVRQIVPTPDGTKVFVTTNLDGVDVFDPRTLQHIGQIGPPGYGMPNAARGAVMSLDGKTLYLVDQLTGSVFGYDTATYQQVSVVPHVYINDLQTWMVASAIDNTGLIIGPIGHGVAFADTAAPESTTVTESVAMAIPSPDTGPVSGNTAISDPYSAGSSFNATISKFYVGNSPISGATIADDPVSLNTPAASSDMPVDLTAMFNDGAVITAPEGYSYGPTILEAVPNAATADGGQQGAVIGYGFGSSASAIQVSVGGQSAPIQNLYDYAPINPYPFPVEALTFTIPAGVAGVTTISITSPSGTTTGTFTYTPKAVSYPVSAKLQQGIYDPHRNLYFFTDTAKIQVFSPESGTWQTPITLPGIANTSQLIGIAESPDGSMLAVADNGGQAIYVLDPDNPGSAVRYPVPSPANGSYPSPPVSLAVLDHKSIFFVAVDILNQVAGSASFHKLDLTTGQFTDFQIGSVGTAELNGGRVLLSPDQSTVFVNIAGSVYWIDTATDTINPDSAISQGFQTADGAISTDGSTISINGYLTDGSLQVENVTAYVDWETWLPTATYGQKLNQDGSILYQPLTNGVDLIERNTGRLLYRVQVPGMLASAYDPMFLGASAGVLGYLTAAGVTFVDLSSLAIPAAASTPFPAARSAERKGARTGDRIGLKPLTDAGKRRPTLAISGDGNHARY
ncbi:MAG: IPT/TIG domain-containing protein [Terracidiphilus sp.]